MTGGYRLTRRASTDLAAIWDYIAEDTGANRADGVIRDLRTAIRRLVDHPGIGHRRDDLADETVHVWPVHSFLIIYRPHTRPLEIVHGAWDLLGLFSR